MKKFLSLVLALVMTMSLVTISAGAKDFTDADKVTYTEAVDVLSAVKVIDGYTDGAFKPTTQLNRGQAAKILCNMILGPTTASALKADAAPFKDVAADSTFAGYIAYCAKEGIIDGYTDGTFRPAAPLTGYAFMKLLLGALGYDKDVEGYNGANWSINVAKRALAIGLDDGLVDEFDGTKIVTREEACLFALNTLKADMVEYDAKTNISVGGAEVVIAGSKAKEVANNAKTETIFEDDTMQFAEKYFSNLKLDDAATDAFMRPANQWKVKAESIGTYSQTPDAFYTKSVKPADIYKDLGLGDDIAKSAVTVYVDGVKGTSVSIRKIDDDTTVGEAGNGVLTEVFYNDKADTVTITQVNTYIGKVNRTLAATSTRDAYVEVLTGGAASDYIKAPDGATNTEKFTTDVAFDDDTFVLYTFSRKNGDNEIISLAEAETVEGTITKVENNKKTDELDHKVLTINGEEYKASKKVAQELLDKVSPDNGYTVYLDSYGYTIFVEQDEYLSEDYALVVDYQNKANFQEARALLVLADGTEKVVKTDKDYSNIAKSYYIAKNTIVTIKETDGEYALKAVKTTKTVTANNSFLLKNNNASVQLNSTDKVYANSKTVFVVYNHGDDEWTSYTGIKTAPSINDVTVKKNVTAYTYNKGTSSMATIMFIVPSTDDIVSDANNNLLYVAGESVSNYIHDGDDYYTYNAVKAGEITTIKVADDVTVYDDTGAATTTKAYELNGLYSKYTVDSKGFITSVKEYDDNTANDKYAVDYKDLDAGTNKNSADYTVILGKTSKVAYTVDEDAKIYAVSSKGVIEEGTYAGTITKDDNDKFYGIVEYGMITKLFVEEVKDGVPADTTIYKFTAANAAVASVRNNSVNYTVTFNFEKADFVPADATLTIHYDVLLNGVKIGSDTKTAAASLTSVNDLKAIPGVWYVADDDELSVAITDVTTDLVNVEYVAKDGKTSIKSYLDADNTIFAMSTASAGTSLKIVLPNSTTGNTTIAISGTKSDITATSVGWSNLGSGSYTMAPRQAKGDQAVKVAIDVSLLHNTYTATSSSVALSDLTNADPKQAAAGKHLNVNFSGTTSGLETGAKVNYTVSMDAGTFTVEDSTVRAYRVVIEKLGLDGIIYNGHNLTGKATIGTADLQIAAADVKLYPVEALAIESAVWDATTITITFNRDVTISSTHPFEVNGTATNIQSAAEKSATEKNVVVVTMKDGVVLHEGDVLNIRNNGTIKLSDTYGYEIATSTTITLE